MAIHARRCIMGCTRGCLRLIRNHVFVVVIALVSVIAYRFLPPTISSHVVSSPLIVTISSYVSSFSLIVCTALLLIILFSSARRRVPEPQEQRSQHTRDDHLHLRKEPSSNSESVGLTAAASSGIDSGSDGDDVEDDDDDDDAENQEGEAQQDGTEAVVSWTADDEKNLIDLGTSELERNQRVENLLAKRIATKKQRAAAAGKNLINLDTHDPLPSPAPAPAPTPTPTPAANRFPHMQIRVPPPTFRNKNNPFDLPYSPIPGFPPIPGSAPSVLLLRGNPFDLPYVPPQGGPPDPTPPNPMSLTPTPAHARFEPMPPRHLFFKRHESFTLGGSVHHQQQQMMPQSSNNLNPYFVAERLAANEYAHPALQRQMSGGSDSKLSSVGDSDTSSSVVDELDAEDQEKLNQLEQNLREDEPNSCMEQEENDLSDGVDSMETQPDKSHVDDILVQETGSNTSDDIHEMMHGDGSSSSWSMHSSADEKMIFKTGENDPSSSGQVALTTATLAPVRVAHEVFGNIDYGPVKEPVYDSSPHAVAKTSSNVSSIASDLFPVADKGPSESTSCAVSEPMPVERTIPFDLEGESKKISSAKKQWVASTSLSFVDRNEARSRGVSEVREADVIQAVLESSTEATPFEIHFVHPESGVDGMTDTTSSEASGISVEESAARTSHETQRKHINEPSKGNLETKEITQSSTALERSHLEKKPSDEIGKDDKGMKEITQSSATLEIEPTDSGDKSASQLVDANVNAVNKNLANSKEVNVKELVKEIDEALQANEEIMKSAILKSIEEKAMSADAQVGVTGIGLAQESQVGSSAAGTVKHPLEPPKDIHLDLKEQKSKASHDRPVKDEKCERPSEPESLIQTRSGSENEAAVKKTMLDEKSITALEPDADNNKESIKEVPPEPLIHTTEKSAAEVEAAVKKPMPDDKSITAVEPVAAKNEENIKENSST